MTKKHRPNGQCQVCTHERRYEIELALASGVSCAAVGKKYGVSKHAVWRHLTNHVSDERKAELVAGPLSINDLVQKATDEGMSLLDYLAIVRNALMSRFLAASENGDGQQAAIISGKLLECLRLIAQVSGELTKVTANVTNNTLILNSPLMAELQAMLVRELAPYPEARAKVVAGLEDLSSKALPGPQSGAAGRIIEAQYASGR